jgi:hypothetical protein
VAIPIVSESGEVKEEEKHKLLRGSEKVQKPTTIAVEEQGGCSEGSKWREPENTKSPGSEGEKPW